MNLLLLPEGSEEFQETVRQFYSTLEDFHSKIRIVKVCGGGGCWCLLLAASLHLLLAVLSWGAMGFTRRTQ